MEKQEYMVQKCEVEQNINKNIKKKKHVTVYHVANLKLPLFAPGALGDDWTTPSHPNILKRSNDHNNLFLFRRLAVAPCGPPLSQPFLHRCVAMQ